MRDDFSKPAKEILAKRVSYKCSNPKCKKITIGAHTLIDKTINLGVAAHIHAASIGGPRYCEEMKSEDRKSIQNGIWLCQNCAKLIDTDICRYSPKELLKWKSQAENESLSIINNDFNQHYNSSLFESRIKVNEKLFNEVSEANSLINELINLTGISNKERHNIGYYIGLQVAQFIQDNDFYIQDEIGLQCIGTFVAVSDIFDSKNTTREETLDNFRRNVRASLKLLKSINSDGIIDTTKKTPLMARYNELLEENSKDDFLN
ncbi:hypothetical protein [Flavobacterium ginsenosidimutans]|uniref:HNH endonuclease n=1 Tax=Flavobacterium ginsenosidimutans TaxID=687844 RepID=A0ABZ2Q9M2_9FLAO